MCRWLVFISTDARKELLLADLVLRSENGLVHQSYDASFTPGFERINNAQLNADGFGFGWYHDHGNVPAIFKSAKPLWGESNAREIAMSVKSKCIFAHVRAAGPGSSISEDNCHPFKFGTLLFQHNGHIEGFHQLRQSFVQLIKPDIFANIRGVTDTEHFFGLLLSQLDDPRKTVFEPKELIAAFKSTVSIVSRMLEENGIKTGFTTLNCSLTDGKTCIVSRFCDKYPQIPAPSLYFAIDESCKFHRNLEAFKSAAHGPGDGSVAQKREKMAANIEICEPDVDAHLDLKEGACFIAASEPLLFAGKWHKFPNNALVCFHRSKSLHIEPI